MPSWYTKVGNFEFRRPGAKVYADNFMMSLSKILLVFGIPITGTRWSARQSGKDVVVFAEWTLDDEIRSGFYDL